MLSTFTVRDHMARDVITVRPDTLVTKAIGLLLKHKISGMPVLDEADKLVGILSERDCLKAFVHARYHNMPSVSVEDLMTTEVDTIGPEMGILDVTSLFLSKPFRRLPVLENGQLIGQISRRDVLRAIEKASPG